MAEQQAITDKLKAGKKLKKWELVLYTLVLLLYVAVNIYLMLCHEAWRDESQAWIVAKQLSWAQIPAICASEGHPCLWFYIIKISIVLGLPFRYFSVISIFFMSLATALLLYKAEFRWFSKILIVLSPLFFYYNPVICRNYSVIMFLICMLCTLWKDRYEKPLLYAIPVFFLFQSHVLIFGLAIGCVFDMCLNLIMNKKQRDLKHFGGLLISVTSFVLMLLELRQKSGADHFINITKDYILNRIKDGNWIYHLFSITVELQYGGFDIGLLILLLTFFAVIAFLLMSFDHDFRKKYIGTGLAYLCGIGVYLGIVIFVRDIDHIHMAIVLWMIILFFCWAMRDCIKGYIYEIILVVLCVSFIPKSLIIDPYRDIKGPFSGSKEMAKIIDKNVEDGSVIFVNNNFLTTSIVAYLSDSRKNFTFWDVDNDEEFYIHKCGKKNKYYLDESTLKDHVNNIINKNGYTGSCYFVRGNTYIQPKKDYEHLTLIGSFEEEHFWKEYYWLYKIKK